MFENVSSNKYLIIALAIALIIVLYLYLQKDSCGIEGMGTVYLPNQHAATRPWTDDNDYNDNDLSNNYKKVGDYFDIELDKKIMKQSQNIRKNMLRRTDEEYRNYIGNNDDLFRNKPSTRYQRKSIKRIFNTDNTDNNSDNDNDSDDLNIFIKRSQKY